MNNKACITRSYHFSAAHRLHTPGLSDDVNKKIYGKCNNLNGHGHNYTVLVRVQGELGPRNGLVTDVEMLDRVVHEKIVDRFDHQHLNFDPAFHDLVTTGENLARLIWDFLVNEMPGGRLEKIGLVETRDNYFEYVGDHDQSIPSR